MKRNNKQEAKETEAYHTETLHLQPHLFKMLCRAENLDPKHPLLDLTEGRDSDTLIRNEVRRHLTSDTRLKDRKPNKMLYPKKVILVISEKLYNQNRRYLTQQSCVDINKFIARLLTEHINLQIKLDIKNGANATESIRKVISTLDIGDVFDFEAAKKNDARLRNLRDEPSYHELKKR